jgi:molybdopterin synthase catalytic subunit
VRSQDDSQAGGVLVRVTDEPLTLAEVESFVADPGAGATCIFAGTVRDHSEAGEVTGLRYEAWEDMARRHLRELAQELGDRWPLRKVALLHRIGNLPIGAVSVIVACSSPHRTEAFEACRHGIERLKEAAPIWKKEELASGEAHWVMGA